MTSEFLSISIQKRKQGAISDGFEVDSGFKKAPNKNISDRKRVRKLQRKILSSSESYDSDTHVETAYKEMIWSRKNFDPQIRRFNSIIFGMKIQISRFATPLRLL